MIKTRSIGELKAQFESHGISCNTPEFYNTTAFKTVEQKDPFFLETYAEFVEARDYSPAYIAWVREIVPPVVNFLRDELARDGRQGACLDASLAVSKILERLGIWNHISAGSLTIDFDSHTGLGTRHWAHWMVPGDVAKVGHAWLVVPPFKVLDITLRQQRGTENQKPYLPHFVLSEETQPVEGVSLEDMADKDLLRFWKHRFGKLPTIHEMMRNERSHASVLTRFRPFAVRADAATVKYFTCIITAPQEAFEHHTGHCFSGRKTSRVFDDLLAELGERVPAIRMGLKAES